MPELPPKLFAVECRKSIRTLERWRERGYGPPYTQIGKEILYDVDEWRAWRKKQKRLGNTR